MKHESIEYEIVQTAHQIGTTTAYEDLFDSQLSYWLSVKSLMASGGYESVRKRMSSVSKELAESIAAANLKTIRKLCSAEISTIRPSLPDATIMSLLSTTENKENGARMILQLLAESNMETKSNGRN